MKQEITREMVEMALILKEFSGKSEQNVEPQKKSKLRKAFKHVYCGSYVSNVIECVSSRQYWDDIIKGKGGELSNTIGYAPKFNSITSSTALAVNSFAPWKDELHELKIETRDRVFSKYDYLEFEYITQTKNRSYPNLDVCLQNEIEVLAIECKFCEFLNNNSYTKLQKSYHDMIKREGYSGKWIDAIHKVINSRGQGIYKYFDVVQVIKHYSGVINTDKSEKHLLYLYWHPENQNWNKIHPYDVLESELDEFSKIVLGAGDVQFHYMSFNDLWNQWESKHKEHVLQLREKYSVTLNQSY